ncbi:MAG: HIT family protein [Coriobacteriia bacterium]|nr:HIT family protein [Coriobacteriia bacterium]
MDRGCRFCRVVSGEDAARIVHADDAVVAFLDVRPLIPGHTLVVPRRHVEVLGDLPDELVAPLMRVVRAASRAMESAMGAEGSFVAVNNRVSQSVPHLHVHVVPRSPGDGLRGFFWPRHAYADEREADAVAEMVRRGIAEELARGGSEASPAP